MCDCVNVKMGSYDNQIELQRPKCMIGRIEGTHSNIICIDKCIAEEIQYLWNCGVRTTGCCCGHNIQEGYIGVIEKDIEFVKKSGYRVKINKQRLGDESNFVPKSHNENGKLNNLDYKVLYNGGE